MKLVWLALLASSSAWADLATEKITGTVVYGGQLYPTKATALAAPANKDRWGDAVTVLADHGAVIEVTTKVAAKSDCVHAWDEPYELRLFVRRDTLLPRTTRETVVTFSDGTAVVIDRGAPVENGTWADETLANTKVAAPSDLAYSLTTYKASTLPAREGERLVCHPPMTKTEWMEKQKEEQERKRRSNERPSLQDIRDPEPRWCAITTSADSGRPPAQMPTLDGKPVQTYRPRETDVVRRDGKSFLADIHPSCGHIRVRVDESALTTTGNGASGIGGAHHVMYVPKAGPVTWPDGTPAGKFLGGRYLEYSDDEVKEIKGRYCVQVGAVMERVCHKKSNVSVRK